jgi:hypothetical protein
MATWRLDSIDQDVDERPLRRALAARPRRRLRRSAVALLTVLALPAFAFALWSVYAGRQPGDGADVAPLVHADPSPTRIRPADPGGLEVPHKDRLVLQGRDSGSQTPPVEQLLPPPEQPMDRPEPSDAEARIVRRASPTESLFAPPPPPLSPFRDTTGMAALAQSAALASPDALVEDEVPLPLVEEAPETIAAASAEPPAFLPPLPPRRPAAVGGLPEPAAGPASGGWRIQLASVDSADDADSEWRRLRARHDDVLGDLALDVRRTELNGRTWFRVQAGPLDEEAARAACDALRRQDLGCLVVGP